MRHFAFASRAITLVFVSLAVGACAFEPGGEVGTGDPADPDGPLDPGVDAAGLPPGPTVRCRVDGPMLGMLVTIDAEPMGTYRIERWQTVPGGGLVGFTLSGPSGVRYEVRTGREQFWGETLAWTHPELADDEVTPISRVDLCATPDDGRGD